MLRMYILMSINLTVEQLEKLNIILRYDDPQGIYIGASSMVIGVASPRISERSLIWDSQSKVVLIHLMQTKLFESGVIRKRDNHTMGARSISSNCPDKSW